MMARSRRSNQRPDTVMQDRINQVDETSCTARPDHTVGSKGEILAASKYFPLFFQQQTFEEPLDARHLVDGAISPVTWSRGCLRARKIWIDDALGGAAQCRRVALRQRRVAAFVIVGPPAVHVQTNRISRIKGLGPSRRRSQNRRGRQNRQGRHAHQSHVQIASTRACLFESQFTFARPTRRARGPPD
jgi:hypothetical protein